MKAAAYCCGDAIRGFESHSLSHLIINDLRILCVIGVISDALNSPVSSSIICHLDTLERWFLLSIIAIGKGQVMANPGLKFGAGEYFKRCFPWSNYYLPFLLRAGHLKPLNLHRMPANGLRRLKSSG